MILDAILYTISVYDCILFCIRSCTRYCIRSCVLYLVYDLVYDLKHDLVYHLVYTLSCRDTIWYILRTVSNIQETKSTVHYLVHVLVHDVYDQTVHFVHDVYWYTILKGTILNTNRYAHDTILVRTQMSTILHTNYVHYLISDMLTIMSCIRYAQF